MRFSEQWLRTLVNPPISSAELADQLSALGLEVEQLSAPLHQGIQKVVIGQIIKLEPHPNADKLHVCQVITASSQSHPYTIVCGAKNVTTDLKVALAKVGATLPGGIKIKRTKLRGIVSEGMICSASELGLMEHAAGILPLPKDAPLGEEFCQYYQLYDRMITLDLTPDRADCLSIEGIARDLAARYNMEMLQIAAKESVASVQKDARIFTEPSVKTVKKIPVQVQVDDAAIASCPKYLVRRIMGMRMDAVTPLWMQERLRRSGIMTIHPIVDVTNYVMLELGQPMHAFDFTLINGGIRIRYAQKDEQIRLLNHTHLSLHTGDLVIADQQQPLALAGVMGGQHSAVHAATQDIVLEAAYFHPVQISQTCQRTHIHTDSSHRFERGVSADLPERAMARATELIISICGGQPGAVTACISTPNLPIQQPINLNLTKLNTYSGLTLHTQQVCNILQRLGCRQIKDTTNTNAVIQTNGPQKKQDTQQWQPPAYRFDLEQDVDLIEEVMRITGYDQIPERLPAIAPCQDTQESVQTSAITTSSTTAPITTPVITKAEQKCTDSIISDHKVDRALQRLISYGFYQVINYSFISHNSYQQFTASLQHQETQQLHELKDTALYLANPISEELAVMRPSLLPSLLHNLAYNLHRQKDYIKLFEYGKCYFAKATKSQKQAVEESLRLSGIILVRNKYQDNWQAEKQSYSFFDLKGELFTTIDTITDVAQIDCTVDTTHPWFHPGQCASITIADKPAGYLGALHPRLLADLKLGKHTKVFAFEISPDILLTTQPKSPRQKVLSKYPAVTRDLTLKVKKDFPYQKLAQAICAQAGRYLKSLDFINLYQDTAHNRTSDTNEQAMSFRLTWQSTERTLKEEEVTAQLEQILAYLQQHYAISLKA